MGLHSSDNAPNKSAQLYPNIRDSSHSNLNVRDKSQDSSFSHKPSSFGNLLVKESHSTLPSGTSKPSLLSILSPIKSSTTSQVQESSKNHFISESTTPVTPTQSFTSKSTTTQRFTFHSNPPPSPSFIFSTRSTAQSVTKTTNPTSVTLSTTPRFTTSTSKITNPTSANLSTTSSSEVSSSKTSVETSINDQGATSGSGGGRSNCFFSARFPFTGFAHIQDLNDIQFRTKSRLLSRKTQLKSGAGSGAKTQVLPQSGDSVPRRRIDPVSIFRRFPNFR